MPHGERLIAEYEATLPIGRWIVLKKIMAAVSGFCFIGLAAIFGCSGSPDQLSFVWTVASVFVFVAITAIILGAIFDRTSFLPITISGSMALFLMWIPMQMYATLRSLGYSAIALVLLFFVIGAAELLGSLAHAPLKRAFVGTMERTTE